MKSRWARRATAFAMIMAVTLGVAPRLVRAQGGAPAVDVRQRVEIPQAQRNEILAEMRGMLESLRGILFGLAAGDMAAVRTAAEASSVEATANPELDRRLPKGFLQFRYQTHEGFNSLAIEARSGSTQANLLTKVAGITNNCVGCHRAFRVVEAPASPRQGAPAPR
jgi:cytochrome c556